MGIWAGQGAEAVRTAINPGILECGSNYRGLVPLSSVAKRPGVLALTGNFSTAAGDTAVSTHFVQEFGNSVCPSAVPTASFAEMMGSAERGHAILRVGSFQRIVRSEGAE